MIDEIKEKIANDKEILNVLPQNNARNKAKYLEKVKELKEEYTGLVNQVYNYISMRNSLISSNRVDPTIQELEMKISYLKYNLVYFNKFLDSYEILGLDKLFYELHKYYNSDLESYNDNLAAVIDIFSSVNVSISANDFNFNNNAHTYMCVFFDERSKGNYNSLVVRSKFEELFSSEHNMMRYILLNIKHLYYKNINKFEEYINNKRRDILKEYGNSFDNLLNSYNQLVMERDRLVNNSKALYLDKFINKELNTKDFDEDKINKLIDEIYGENKEVNYELLNNLFHAIKEYQKINEYRYIFDDINKLKKDNDSYKNIVKNTFKEISKKESIVLKKNNPNFLDKILHKNNEDLSSVLEELDNDYENLLVNKYKEDIYNLSPDANLEEYLALACSIHYLIDVLNRSKMEDVETSSLLNNIEDLLYSPYNSLINNISYKDIDRINYIIFDKYKLLGVDLNIESLSIDNLDNFIYSINNIVLSRYLKGINFNTEEVEFLILSNDIIKNRNN